MKCKIFKNTSGEEINEWLKINNNNIEIIYIKQSVISEDYTSSYPDPIIIITIFYEENKNYNFGINK